MSRLSFRMVSALSAALTSSPKRLKSDNAQLASSSERRWARLRSVSSSEWAKMYCWRRTLPAHARRARCRRRRHFFFLPFFSYRGCGGKVLFFASFFFAHCRQICRQFRRQICRQIFSFEAYGLRLIFAPDGLAQAADELLDFGCCETFAAFHLIKGNK